MKLIDIIEIKGCITLKSGLHIGSGDMEMHIGGTDSPVIKHPHTGEPYIPGSSIKGKVRSMLELESGLMITTEGEPVSAGSLTKLKNGEKKTCEDILKIFGAGADNKNDDLKLGPTRASFRDCLLDEDWKKKAKENRWSFTEVKSENTINRIKGTAEHPRFIERVPEGVVFDFLITFKIFEGDDKGLKNYLLRGLRMLEMDALGGSGSRGYGRIKIDLDDKEELDKQFHGLKLFDKN